MNNQCISNCHGKNGFTFVEMVIVGVIIAIISAVAIPIYTGTIKAKRQAMVDELAQTAAVSANSYLRRTGSHPDSADLNLFFPQANRFTVDINAGESKIIVTDTKVSIASDPAYY